MGRPGLVIMTVVAVAAGILNVSVVGTSLMGRFGDGPGRLEEADLRALLRTALDGADDGPAAGFELPASPAGAGAAATAAGPEAPPAAGVAAGRPAPQPSPGPSVASGRAAPAEPVAGHVGLDADPLLSSPMLSNPEFQREVRQWIRFWSTKPRSRFPAYLARMNGFEPMVDSILAARGLPWSLRYLPIIESGYDPTAVSRASAVGMWQFMAPTAGDFGVEVTRYVDDRRDPIESTAAAAEFLSQLHAEFGSWFLALAAYNAGPGRVRTIIQHHAPGARPSDALYWRIRPHLPRETRDYVPNLFGAMVVALSPERYGYDDPAPVPFEFDRVPVQGRVQLETVARATRSTLDEIERLNPEYVRGVTPDRRQVDLRVPTGSAASLREYFARERQAYGGGG